MTKIPTDICIVGGAGHVGLPLAIVFALKGQNVLIYDTNPAALDLIARGEMPFMEKGAEPLLKQALKEGRLRLSSRPSDIAGARALVITIGTPIDEFLNPTVVEMARAFEPLLPFLSDGQLIILRSTVFPGTTAWLASHLSDRGKRVLLSFCPERIVQGLAIEELQKLPQIISGMTPEAEEAAGKLFSLIAPEVVRLAPQEAEFSKLFCNAYRYIQFAISNQFYTMVSAHGLDYYKILDALKKNYSRMADMPKAGLAAGPCLLKDTMQLTAFSNNEFSLGLSAMQVNEGLPLRIVEQLGWKHDLSKMTVGLLGMAFKADIDDPRSSLSYKLKKVLIFKTRKVLTTDPYVKDADLVPLETVVAESDILILCTPHKIYKGLDTKGKIVIDIWNYFGKGGLI